MKRIISIISLMLLVSSVYAVDNGTYRIGCDLGGEGECFYLDCTSHEDWSARLINTPAGDSMMKATSLGRGEYKIETAGKSLTRKSDANGEFVSLYSYNAWSTQKWGITDVGDGYYKITSVTSGNALTRNDTANGIVLLQNYSGLPTQKWKLLPADGSK